MRKLNSPENTNLLNSANSFSDVYNAKHTDDWNENKVFTDDFTKAFNQFKKKYPLEDTKK
jgi:hypothetical protein